MITSRVIDYSEDVRAFVVAHDQLAISVAFVSKAGLDEIRPQILELLARGGRLRCLVDLTAANTDPSAIWDLLAIKKTNPKQLELRTYLTEDDGFLHSKLFIGTRLKKDVTIITGSANLSHAALFDNVEHGVLVTGEPDEGVVADSISYFEQIWSSAESKPIDEEAARLYESYCGRKRAAQRRAQRKSTSAWGSLERHLAQMKAKGFVWPSFDAAYLMGAITARGILIPDENKVDIRLLFNPRAYKEGNVAVRDVSYRADDVLPSIPQEIARRTRALLPDANIVVEKNTVSIDLSQEMDTFNAIRAAFDPALHCNTFRLPQGLVSEDEDIVTEYVRGFAVACALLTDNTSMPGNPRTGMPGQMVVWLRPKQANQLLFYQLYELIQRRLGITVYRHDRIDRDPHLKIGCEHFTEIGFGIDWWDALVEEGARYNFSLFPQLPLSLT